MAFLPYHRIAYISTEDIRQARWHLEKGLIQLKLFSDTVLPKFYDLVYDFNPLQSLARGEDIVNRERYIVMEFIQGCTLHEIMRAIYRTKQPNYEALEWLAWNVASTTTNFSLSL